MQYELELNNTLPNQTFTTKINNIEMELEIRTGGSDDNPITYAALLVNNEYLCKSVPVFANQKVLPYNYMQSFLGGNFFFTTENGDYPYYKNFNNSCKLIFLTLDELNG